MQNEVSTAKTESAVMRYTRAIALHLGVIHQPEPAEAATEPETGGQSEFFDGVAPMGYLTRQLRRAVRAAVGGLQ